MLVVSDGMLFWLERARHSHILQVYRHPTSIQTPYKYTDTIQVFSTQNTSPDTQIQVQTPKYKSRHPKYKSRHPKYKSRHRKYKSRHPKYMSRRPKYICQGVYGHIQAYIIAYMAIYCNIWPYMAIYIYIYIYIWPVTLISICYINTGILIQVY